ncbi:putative F420-dependent oxidoreductase, MSMEG_2256 family [Frankia sp. EI5c]|uniref:TIGR03617 family F420-dependent LLM class oxidoreductase n=1 Tax=Frankia sp. EI5c TaxID=683316 RepID=UPI0007C31C7B|nr:TIGR03617 family F420-dependent LLM class oxidoreductase [Frankia sp. EI5c]OAA25653.1 putative F420-dependent oxidoreductase, MSMEG_2256 family [Frankia sp. EI5c]
MKVDTTLGPAELAVEQARSAQETGYDGIWTGEVNHDPFLPLTLAAHATSRLELGTSITVALARSPMSLAYTAHDLQRFSAGRLRLGLGSQVRAHITRRFSMPWGRPAAQLREFVLAMRAIWSCWSDGIPLAFEGEYYRHTLMPPAFVPKPHPFGPPPVLLAGVGDVMTQVAGEVADGFQCHWFTTPRWIREHTIPALERGRAQTGRTLDGFEILAGGFVATGSDREIVEGVARMRSQIAFYASTPTYRPVLELHGWGALGDELTVLSKQNRWAEMPALIEDDVIDAFGIVATPAELPARLAERLGGLVTRVAFAPPASFDPDQVRETLAAVRAVPAFSPTRPAGGGTTGGRQANGGQAAADGTNGGQAAAGSG